MQANFIVINIGKLLNCSDTPVAFKKGRELSIINELENAWLLVSNGKIKDFGSMRDQVPILDTIIDAEGGLVMPSWIDAHTHLVFADTRETEFVDRIKGLSYQEIAQKGGGILNSAKKLQELDEDELFERSINRLFHAVSLGTGAFEIKSGYGLTPESELKILRVIKRLKQETGIPIRSTFLGAHAYPLLFRDNHQAYLDQMKNIMLPAIVEEGLADYVDVFCEKGFFSLEETEFILKESLKYGLKSRLHTNQFTHSGGIELAIRYGATTVDHLEELNQEEISMLLNSNVIPVALPTAAFFMNCNFPPARQMIESGLGLVIASDYNPGTSPSADMNLCFALSCIKMRMLPNEVLNAMTINAAYSLGLESELGSIERGKKAHLIISKPGATLDLIPYSLSNDWIEHVILGAVEEDE